MREDTVGKFKAFIRDPKARRRFAAGVKWYDKAEHYPAGTPTGPIYGKVVSGGPHTIIVRLQDSLSNSYANNVVVHDKDGGIEITAKLPDGK